MEQNKAPHPSASEHLDQLHRVLEAGLIGVWEYDPITHIVLCSAHAKQLFGFDSEEVVTLPRLLKAVHENDRIRVSEAIDRAIRPRSEENLELEYALDSPNGVIPRIIRSTGKAFFNAGGIAYRFVGTAVEVAPQKSAAQALQASQAYFRAIADTAPVMIWISDTDKRCNFFNKGWLDFTGRSMEQEYGHGWAEGVHPDDVERCLHTYTSSFDARQSFSMEYRLRRQDGQYRWLLDNGVPRFLPDGQFVGYIGSCIDIDQSKTLHEELENRVAERTRALAQANDDLIRSYKNLEQFSFVASHDLQEPLRKIQSFCTVLIDEYGRAVGDNGIDLMQRMQSAANRMQTLIQGLLGYSRTARPGPFEAVDLGRVVSQVLDDLEMAIAEQAAQITVDPLPTLMGDPLQLHQLFQNLLTNALKFARSDQTLEISIESHTVTHADFLPALSPPFIRWEVISVRDNGIGFAPEYSERIFQIFERLHGRMQYPGAGIGLAVCKQVVENHRGLIRVQSQPNQGTTFTLYLPTTIA
ncbi:sensor histidine kinase [Larkinella knui]|uniref:sensor histidine kinase n=1 Tax=Larkinella knui TaxID=2025310 RepID=UPI001C8A21F8|nr:PAS domain-containing sensor histidine kinase [Larkinella knui]